MQKSNIILSTGTLVWFGLKQIITLAKGTGYDGVEIVPTRRIVKETIGASDLKFMKSIHHNWRLDIGQDQKYGINKFTSLIFTILRLIFCPSLPQSKIFIQNLSTKLNCPVTVHEISPKWTKDNQSKEFLGGISYEIMDTSTTPDELRRWLRNSDHSIVVDSRDDQSLLWAKKYGFRDWKELWTWIGLKKIKGIQLTLIGLNGIKKILNHEETLPEQQLLWLYEKRWEGTVTVEVNPISLYISSQGRLRQGLKTILNFTRQTLVYGKKWSY